MALLYPWATKEYLLWNMSFPQIIMYHKIGVELKYGKADDKPTMIGKSYDELAAIKEEMTEQGLIERKDNG